MSRILKYDITAVLKAKVHFQVEAHDESEADEIATQYLWDNVNTMAAEAAESEDFDNDDLEVIEIVESDDNGEDDEDWPEDDYDREQRAAAMDDRADDDRVYNESVALETILNKVNKVK